MKLALILATLTACVFPTQAKPLKVFILAGQSNMEGPASIKAFDYIGDDPATAPMLSHVEPWPVRQQARPSLFFYPELAFRGSGIALGHLAQVADCQRFYTGACIQRACRRTWLPRSQLSHWVASRSMFLLSADRALKRA